MLARAARGTGGILLRGSVRAPSRAPRRASSGLPRNTVVLFVPQQEAWVVERMGRFHRILEPDMSSLLSPMHMVNEITKSLMFTQICMPTINHLDHGMLCGEYLMAFYLLLTNEQKLKVTLSLHYAVTQLAQTTMRSELGKLSLDKVFRERESLNASIVDAINQAADCWGIRCLRYEIKDIHVPPRVKESMQMQVEAERRKRATVLESEGTRESAINVAEGKKQAQILASEAEKAEQINQAAGEASAVLAKAKAKAEAIRILAAALTQHNGDAAASLTVAEQYVNAFSKLAKDSNTILLPTNPGDVTSMVAQAMGVYGALTKAPVPGAQDPVSSGSSRDVPGTDTSLDEELDQVKLS
uniref:Stomatin like 2 n=1 Tax=Loxodonta africana TaxID=9785 RepID=G3TP93_LOXAF